MREFRRGQRLTADELAKLQEAINANKQIRNDQNPGIQGLLGTSIEDGGAGQPGFWARLLTDTGTALYTFEEVYWAGPTLLWVTAGRTGLAEEANEVTGLAGKIAWIPNFEGDYEFVWHWHRPCELKFCIAVWSTPAYCEIINAGEGPGWDCTTIPGGVDNADIFIKRVKHDGITEVDFLSANTNADGYYCPEMGPTIDDPVDDPTVDPVGAGASGGDLEPGTYIAAYSYINDWGSTRLSNPTNEFQIGIADSGTYPVIPAPSAPHVTGFIGGLLAVGTYTVKVQYVDGAGKHNRPTAMSVPFTVANLGDIWTITLPSISLRDYAVAMDVYLSDGVSGGGFWYLYKSGEVGPTVDLDIAFVPVTLPPAGNDSDLNIPQLTYTPSGTDDNRIYAIFQLALGVNGQVWYKDSPASPDSLFNMNMGFYPDRNSTGDGQYRITVDKDGCKNGPCDITINGDCGLYWMGFGLCCYEVVINASDNDTAGPVDIGEQCGSGIVVNQEAQREIPCRLPDCPGPPEPTPHWICDEVTGFHTPECDIAVEDYLTRCILIGLKCGLPTEVLTYNVLMFPESGWANQPDCPCAIVEPDVRPPGILPKTLFVTISGPEALIGTTGDVIIEVHYDETASTPDNAIYTSGCMGSYGGWGWCFPEPVGGEHCYYKFDPSKPCNDEYGNHNWENLGNPFVPEKVFYQSTKVIVAFKGFNEECKGSPYGAQLVEVQWHNFWNADCPFIDEPPSCGWFVGSREIVAFGAWPCSYFNCDCGQVPPGPGFIHGYCGSYSCTAKGCTTCAPVVNVSGEGIPGPSLLPGDGTCILCKMHFTLTE